MPNNLTNKTAVVAGGTGNVGFYLVDGLLRAGASVLVPSRSPDKLDRLRARLRPELRDRLTGIAGDVGTAEGVREVARQIEYTVGDRGLDAAVSTVASWHQGLPMLTAGFDAFRAVIEATLYPHFLIAKALIPLLVPVGAYTTINGPAGFTTRVAAQIGPIAAATAAQNRLVQAIADETGGHPRVNEVVMWAYIGPDGTRPGSALTGEQIGVYVAWLSSRSAPLHGQTIQLQEPDQVAAVLFRR